jgi:hypothetical protein
MAKQKKSNNPDQLTLYDAILREQSRQELLHPEGRLDVNTRFRAAISEAIKRCPLSRPQIAAQMTELTGVEITVSMLNSWTAESKEQHRFPAIFLPAFFEVTKAVWAYRVLSNPVGLYIMESPDALRSELAAIEEQIKKLQQERRKRRAHLQLIEKK